ncbi:stage VI sporulation protein D [Bacillus sp. FJAT-42315]|uniref:stage VI sporulation protein D n=1 Tax=Bacillus sp. FJAT-42315 TaxID=2014077 RepID=UPI0012FEE798|nr:stage VI sporulation protein D [Bacillus sp. FJAT-42315]
MTSQDQSYLRFSLEETIRFDRGQEVEELYSISLDPQIQMEEQDQFVRLHGCLELSGEYQPAIAEETDSESNQSVKYVQQVLERNEHECEFFHPFPIDITIPKNRIERLEEVEIYIDSFDYELPQKGDLKLTVDLSISGIYGEQQTHRPQEPELLEEERDQVATEEPVVPVALEEFGEEQQGVSESAEEEVADELEFSMVTLDLEPITDEQEEADFAVEVKRKPNEADQEIENTVISTIQKREEMKETQQVENSEMIEQEEESSSPVVNEEMESSEMLESQEETPAPEPKKKKSFSFKQTETMSLADFFARKEEDEPVTWKVCLVQKDDTLQKLAERYGLLVADIVKENKLEAHQSITEGQVLYIPSHEKVSK